MDGSIYLSPEFVWMSRRPTTEEIRLACKLVGPDLSEIDTLTEQLAAARVRELEGSLRDVDGASIIFILLQRDGYVWRLDIARADSGRIQGQMNFDAVVALGFGQ